LLGLDGNSDFGENTNNFIEKMPRSKRERPANLSKTKKHVSSDKTALVDRVREAVDTFESIYAIGFQELRSNHLQAVRVEFRDSR
jgi:hypothetical protein